MTSLVPEIAEILGGPAVLRVEIGSLMELRAAVERGLPVRSLHLAVRRITTSRKDAAGLTHSIVPRTTLHRRTTRLSKAESERLERLARMTALAEEVWEDADHAHEFLLSEQPQLGGQRPVDLTGTDVGTREVEDLLFKMEYSLPA